MGKVSKIIIVSAALLLFTLCIIAPRVCYGLSPFASLPIWLKIIVGLLVLLALVYFSKKDIQRRIGPPALPNWFALLLFVAALAFSSGVPIWANAIENVPAISIKRIRAALDYPGELVWSIIVRDAGLFARKSGKVAFEVLPFISALLAAAYAFLCGWISRRKVFRGHENLAFLAMVLSGAIPTIIGVQSPAMMGLVAMTLLMGLVLRFTEKLDSPGTVAISFAVATLLYPPSVIALPVVVFVAVRAAIGLKGERKFFYALLFSIISLAPLIFIMVPRFGDFFDYWSLSRLFSIGSWGDALFSTMLAHPILPLASIPAVIGLFSWKNRSDIEKLGTICTLCFFVGALIIAFPRGAYDWPLIVGLSPLVLFPMIIWAAQYFDRKGVAVSMVFGLLAFFPMLISLGDTQSNRNWIDKLAESRVEKNPDAAMVVARAAEYRGDYERAYELYSAKIDGEFVSLYDNARMIIDIRPNNAEGLLKLILRNESKKPKPYFAMTYIELKRDKIEKAFLYNNNAVIKSMYQESIWKVPILSPAFRLERDLAQFVGKGELPRRDFALFALFDYLLYGGLKDEYNRLFTEYRHRDILNQLYLLRVDKEGRIDEVMNTLKARDLGSFTTGDEMVDDLVLEAARKTVVGDMDKALPIAEKVIENVPNYARIYYILGYGMQIAGDADSALALYEKTVELDENFANAWANMGVIQAEKGNLEIAEKYTRKAIEIIPDKAYYHMNLGRVYSYMGDKEATLREMQTFMRLDPHTPDSLAVAREIARLKKQLGIAETKAEGEE